MLSSATTRAVLKPGIKELRDFVTLLEILIAWALIEGTIWTSGAMQRRLFWISALFIVVSTILHRARAQELGLGVRGLRPSLWVIPAAAALASAAILLAELAGTLHPLFGFIGVVTHSTAYVIWAVFQQFIVQSYFFLRFEQLVPAHSAVLLSASLFCLAHIPNPVLATVCLFAGSKYLCVGRGACHSGPDDRSYGARRHSSTYARRHRLLPLSRAPNRTAKRLRGPSGPELLWNYVRQSAPP
jgi:hypothetical protein